MKQVLRKQLLNKRASQTPEAIMTKSKAIEKLVFTLPEWKKAKTVMTYAATPSEVQTKEIVQKGLAKGKIMCLPGVPGEKPEMDCFLVNDYDSLNTTHLGFLQPEMKKE